MKRISDAVHKIISDHPVLNFGVHHRLLNLSQVARFIHNAVEIQTQKKVRDSAVLMSLSRLQSKLYENEFIPELSLDKIALRSGLTCFTVQKSHVVHQKISNLVGEIHAKEGFITLSEGLDETMIFLDSDHYELATQIISDKPKFVLSDAAVLSMTFYQDTMAASSVIYQITQQLSFHDIKIIGLTTAQREIHIYLTQKDVRLAFDTVYRAFSKRVNKSETIDNTVELSQQKRVNLKTGLI